MAPPVTEVAYLPLKPGSTPEDSNSSTGKIWQDTLTTLLAQPGVQRAYYGKEVENPGHLWLFVDWASHSAHIDFTKDERVYTPFVKKLVEGLVDGGPSLHHVAFNPHPASRALSDTNAPVTEVFNMYFPTTYSESDQEKHAANLAQLGKNVAAIPGFKGFAGGWIVEESVPYEAGEGGKAKAFTAVVGWDSVEAHMKGREHQAFKDSIGLVSEAGGIIGKAVFHVPLTEVQPTGA